MPYIKCHILTYYIQSLIQAGEFVLVNPPDPIPPQGGNILLSQGNAPNNVYPDTDFNVNRRTFTYNTTDNPNPPVLPVPNPLVQNNVQNNVGVFGCALSHIRLWEKFEMDNTSDIWMVLEDDVIFNENFASEWSDVYKTIKDDDWDLCYLGFLFFEQPIKDTDIKINNKVYQLVKSEKRLNVGGTHCYVIRRSGVVKILEIARKKKISRPIDWLFIDNFDTIKSYIVYPMLTDQDRKIPSSVQGSQKTLKGIEKGIEK